MLERCLRILLIATLVLFSAAVMAQGNGLPWDQVIGFDVSTLDENDRRLVGFLARRVALGDSDEDIVARLAAGLDLEQYRRDVTDEALVEEVMADKFEGLELGVDRTPTIFINGKQYWGDVCIMELADRVDEELDMVW